MSWFVIENVRLDQFDIVFNLFDHKLTYFIELIIISGVVWDLIILLHDTNRRKPKSHAWIRDYLLIMTQRRCQISPWSHGHPITSPETHFDTSLSLQGIGQTKPIRFHHFWGVGSWMSGMNNQKWKMNFEFRHSFFLRAKIFAFPMLTQILKRIEQEVRRDTAVWKSQEGPKSCMCIFSTVMWPGASISFLWCSLER